MGKNASTPLELIPCNLCGRDDFRVVYNSPFHLSDSSALADFVASTDRFDHYGQIVKCRGCGLVYTNPRLMPQKIRQGYSQVVDDEYAQEDSSRSINAHICLSTLKKFVKTGRLLEVGCSTGYFLNAARLDFDVAGVELSRWAVQYAREKLKLNVKEGTLDDAGFPPEHFDAVAMVDVIEHLTDPFRVLKQVHGLLKPQGLVYIVTPDIESFSSRLLRGKWWGLRPAHIYYFSLATLSALLEKSGYEVVFHKSYGRIFTYGYWLSRIKNYPWPLYKTVEGLIRLLGLENKFLYLDTRDSLEICARKR